MKQLVMSENQELCILGSATTSRANSKSCSCALGTAGRSWLPWLCHLSPCGAPFKGFPAPASTGTLHQACLPPIQCVLNRQRPGKCQGLSSWSMDGSVCPHLYQNRFQWQELVSAAMSVWTAPADLVFPPSHSSPTKSNFFPQSCNCPSSFPYLVCWFLSLSRVPSMKQDSPETGHFRRSLPLKIASAPAVFPSTFRSSLNSRNHHPCL